jgi:hypothetical protein
MTPDEFEAGKQWLNETFHLIRYLSNLIADVTLSRVSPNLLECTFCPIMSFSNDDMRLRIYMFLTTGVKMIAFHLLIGFLTLRKLQY